MTDHVLFYHYTSVDGLGEILASGRVNASSPDDNHTHFGPGTYGTSLPPSRGQDAIAANNWKDHGADYIRAGKVSWALEFRIPRNKIKVIPGKRDILLHLGPVYLTRYEWREMEVPPHGGRGFLGNTAAVLGTVGAVAFALLRFLK